MPTEPRTPGTAVPRSRLTPRTSLGAPRRESLGGTPGRSALKTPSRLSRRVPLTPSNPSPDDAPSRPASRLPKRSATFVTPRRPEGRPSLGREGRPSLGREGRPSLGRDTESRLITPKKLTRPTVKAPAATMTPSQVRAEAARKRREAAEKDATTAPKSRRSSAVGAAEPAAMTPSQMRAEAARKRREAAEADAATARRSSAVGALEAGKIIGGRRTRTPVAKTGARLGDRGVAASSAMPSPQARRATGGAPNHRTSLLVRRRASGGGVASPARKLAMPGEEAAATGGGRPRTIKSPSRSRAEAMNKISSMTNGSHRMEDMPEQTVTPRGGAKNASALESFRKVRRESLEQSNLAEKNAAAERMREEGEGECETGKEEKIPDRPDPAGELGAPAAPVRGGLVASDILGRGSTPVRGKRMSARFSDADLCLDGVDKLRLSIGRRRSRGGADLSAIHTPTLKRGQQRESTDGGMSFEEGEERTPLKALVEGEEGNGEEEVKCKAVRLSLTKSPMKAFHLEDTALTWAECDDDDMLDR